MRSIYKHAFTFIKGCIAFALFWYLFDSGRITTHDLASLFRLENVLFALLSSLLYFLSQILASLRLVFLLKAIGYPMNFGNALRLTFIGNFFNVFLPGIGGGDIAKAYYLAKDEEKARGRSTGILIMDRVLGLLAILLLAALGILYLFETSNTFLTPYKREITIVFGMISLIAVVFSVVVLSARNRALREQIKRVAEAILKKSVLFYAVQGFGRLAERKSLLPLSFLCSIAIQVLCLAGLYTLIFTLPNPVSNPLTIMAISSVIIMAGLVPLTPGNMGWLEFIAAHGWAVAGSSSGGVVFLYWRIITTLCALPGGILYFVRKGNKT